LSPEKRAIVMIAIGDRPWSTASARTFAHYAREVGADLHLVTEDPPPADFPLADLADRPGRRDKRAYAAKAFYAWKFLEPGAYDRVLVLDDSCLVRRGAGNLFELAPPGACGFTGTSASHAEQSFEVIRQYCTARDLALPILDPGCYMNTGVMLYDRAFREALSPDRICEAADLLFAPYPNQTLTYYLLQRAGVEMFRMPKSYNTIPAMKLGPAARSLLDDISGFVSRDIQIYHLTSAFKNRGALVDQLAGILLKDWEA